MSADDGALWAFVRGDLPGAGFERVLYADESLEGSLGRELYLEAIGTDFRSGDAVWRLRERLRAFLRGRGDRGCRCVELRDLAVIDMGEESEAALRTLDPIAERGAPRWWLWLARCAACGQHWLVGSEERQNDVYCLRRVDEAAAARAVAGGAWPADFDTYEALLVAGKEAGKSVRFVDPIGDSSLAATVEQLATERPGIGLRRVAQLLALDAATARAIAAAVIAETGVEIDLEG